MPDVFISYRRGDAAGHAGRLSDSLSTHFGTEHVFMDIDAISPGADFVDRIRQAVSSCNLRFTYGADANGNGPLGGAPYTCDSGPLGWSASR